MVQRLASAGGGGNGYLQVFFDTLLPDEVTETAGTEVGVQRLILGAGLA